MIPFSEFRNTVVNKIKAALDIEVIRSNQNSAPPKKPYISYTITTLMNTNNGAYGEYVENGKKISSKEFQQIWSFTVYADDDLQSKEISIALYDYLDNTGSDDLAENGVVIQRIGNITNRDTLLTVDYEYRNGFDVTFNLTSVIERDSEDGIIQDFSFTNNSI